MISLGTRSGLCIINNALSMYLDSRVICPSTPWLVFFRRQSHHGADVLSLGPDPERAPPPS